MTTVSRTGSGNQPERFNLKQLFFPGETGIDTLSELLARLEMRHMFGRQRHRFTCFGVSADTRRTVMQGETAKTPDFYPLPGREGPAHLFKKTLDGQFDILVIKVAVFNRKYLDHFRLCHFLSPTRITFSVPVNPTNKLLPPCTIDQATD